MPDSPTALIVDDDDAIRGLISLLLERAGYEVRAFGDAEAALCAAQTVAPDVYVLDVRLPGTGGREMCQRLKADASTSRPVLMISAETTVANVASAFAAGCDDFVGKPFTKGDLVRRIDALLVR